MTAAEFRKALKRLGLTQSEAARRLYVTFSAVNRWATGKRSIPGPVIAALESWERERRVLEALAARAGEAPRRPR
jgi:transcriptional regulator with XRE-family HTH domain